MQLAWKFRWLLLGLVGLLGCVLAAPWLYFHYHCSEASTWAVLGGVAELREPSVRFSEIAPSQFLMRAGDVRRGANGEIDFPLNRHLEGMGWTFQERMGAGLDYEREDQRITALYTMASSNYVLVSFGHDLQTGGKSQRSRPFNLFGL